MVNYDANCNHNRNLRKGIKVIEKEPIEENGKYRTEKFSNKNGLNGLDIIIEKSLNLKTDQEKLSTLKKKREECWVGEGEAVLVIYRIIIKGSIFVQLESEMERNVVHGTHI